MEPGDNSVDANRAAHPRRTPGRPQVGDDLLPRLYLAAAAAVVIATVVLLVLI